MGQTEKQTLLNAITLKMVEDYSLNLKEVKGKLQELLQGYHITFNNEKYIEGCQDTEYLLQKFTEGKEAVGMRKETIKQYIIAVQKLELYSKKQLADIDAEDINNFLITYGKTVSSVTLRAKYQLLSSVYNYLFLHNYIPSNPITYVATPKADVKYQKAITEVDVEKIKNSIEKLDEKESARDMAIIHFFISTGCRVSELCNVKIKDVDFRKKTCILNGKGKKQREVVITDKALYRIQLYLQFRKYKDPNDYLFTHIRGKETKMTKDGVRVMLNKLKDASGVEKVTCHSFRRFYATELRKRDISIQMIASSLGHSNLNQINRYSLYNNSEMIDTIRAAL